MFDHFDCVNKSSFMAIERQKQAEKILHNNCLLCLIYKHDIANYIVLYAFRHLVR